MKELEPADQILEDLADDRLHSLEHYLQRFPHREGEVRQWWTHAREILDSVEVTPRAGHRVTVRRVGRYELSSPIGSGGQGQVFQAFDPELQRIVAVKTIHAVGLANPRKALARLRTEARLASTLRHDGICPILDIVEHHGQTWVVMPLFEGDNLASQIQKARIQDGRPGGSGPAVLWESLREKGQDRSPEAIPAPRKRSRQRADLYRMLEIFEDLCLAIDAAHRAGVIHRDLKPGNLFLREDGSPVVLDFGLAIDVQESVEARLSESGELLGTPHYMAPEQVDGNDADSRTDVYSLGVVLYELATLEVPFRGKTLAQLFDNIRAGCTCWPSQLNPGLPSDFDVVCAKAMATEPTDRYQTAAELAEDIRRLRYDDPPKARRASVTTRVRRRLRKKPGLAMLGALTVLSLSAFVLARMEADRREQAISRLITMIITNEGSEKDAEELLEIAARNPDAVRERVVRMSTDEWDALVLTLQEATRTRHGAVAAVHPIGTILEPTPEFRFEAKGWDETGGVAVCLESATGLEGVRTLAARYDVERGQFVADLDSSLEAGDYLWWPTRDASDHMLTSQPPIAFHILPAEERGDILAIVGTADDRASRIRRVFYLLRKGMGSAALRELDGEDPIPGTLADLLRVRAYGLIRDRDRQTAIRDRLREKTQPR